MEAYGFLQKHFVEREKKWNNRILEQNIAYILLVISKAALAVLKLAKPYRIDDSFNQIVDYSYDLNLAACFMSHHGTTES